MRAPPTRPRTPTPTPGPVKARLEELAVTGEAVGAVVPALPFEFPPPPPPLLAAVVVEAGGTVVVVVDPPPAKAMTGAMGLPLGAALTIPEATELFG